MHAYRTWKTAPARARISRLAHALDFTARRHLLSYGVAAIDASCAAFVKNTYTPTASETITRQSSYFETVTNFHTRDGWCEWGRRGAIRCANVGGVGG